MKRFRFLLTLGWILTGGEPVLAEDPQRGRILDRNGEVLAETVEGERRYPQGMLTGHLTGYLRAKDQAAGVAGLEKACDESLARGEDLTLTVDLRLQGLVREQFPEDAKGAVVVMDPRSGDILAIASFPGFDPNDFIPFITQERFIQLQEDSRRPLWNRAISPQVPGSVFKIPAALTAGDAGKGEQRYPCTGGVEFGNKYLKCWIHGKDGGGHGELDASGAVKHSCNSWFYQLTKEIGLEPFETTNRMLGLYEPTGCGLPGEGSGTSPSEFFATRGMSATPGDVAMMSIGQGVALATPLQLASMTATLANGGRRFPPRLAGPGNPSSFVDLTQGGLGPDSVERVRKAMANVVNEEGGTGRNGRSEEWVIAGKTGTAAVGGRNRAHNAWFVGFAPADDPTLAICVFVEEGGSGNGVAAPIGREILEGGLRLSEE